MKKICIDPGHGGRDPGATGNGWKEADVVLNIALKAESLLKGFGFSVHMTRRENTTVELHRRSDFASAMQSNVFVSIHANAATNAEAKGFEVFHYPGSARGKLLARAIHEEAILLDGLRDRGVKDARFFVLKHTPCPAVLVETAFISNRKDPSWDDEEYLTTDRGRLLLAEAIARGIREYLR